MARDEDGYDRRRRRVDDEDGDERRLLKRRSDARDPTSRADEAVRDREQKRRRYSSDDSASPPPRTKDRRDRDRSRSPPPRRQRSRSRDTRDDRPRQGDDRGGRERRDDRRDERRYERRNDQRDDRHKDYERAHQRRSPPPSKSRGPLPSQGASFAIESGTEPPVEKQKPNFAPTGLLAKEANTVSVSGNTSARRARDVVLKYHEPPEARKPPAEQAWRLYHFEGKEAKEPSDTIALGERSCWLFGRETGVVDVLLEGATVGKQHAVVQFRYSVRRNEYGDKVERVKPYLIDLESKAGTTLNSEAVEAGRYIELRDGDGLGFGGGEGEWVLMLPPAE